MFRLHVDFPSAESKSLACFGYRESFEFMYGRHWQQVVDFYSNVVNGQSSLFELFENGQVGSLF